MVADPDLVTGSLNRLVAILDVFAGMRHAPGQAADPPSLGVSEVSRALGLPKGTISRYLSRLENAGILQRLPDRRYVLGSRVYEWGQAAAPGSDVKRWAHPVMEQLAAEFGETVSLFVLLETSGEAVCIDQVDGLHPIRLSAAVGRHLPLHVGASPRLLLAFAPEQQREAVLARDSYPALAPATITDAATLRRKLEQTRIAGYVESVGESDDGAVGIAAPIRDASGVVRAAISVAGPSGRITGRGRKVIVTGVCDAAAAISRSLGFRPGPDNGRELSDIGVDSFMGSPK